ncbi:hypothetical protein [Roseateles depolymerans]|uniref:Uncharacterized protein n=1 Tax=Roseateles depolymerans TaxID=76731 RepID=A0A0U3MGS8_9BURK|nr:hypothetical protein [Roseateles depolymerans]ALV07609.1 hypothetical protein RD2015_3149 [Roseateles depolymerans]REG22168.1 hypothetical protein DES44_1312 [Roseateles depolymerans]
MQASNFPAVFLALLLPATVAFAESAPTGEGAPSSLDDRVELSGHSLADRVHAQPTRRVSVTQSAAEPLATANLPGATGSWYGRSPTARQTMVWGQPFAGNGLRVGLGVEQRGAAIGGGLYQNPYRGWRAGAAGDSGVLVGLALPMTARSHVFVQTPLVEGERSAYQDLNLNGAESQGRQVRVGMVFSSRKAYADLRKGLRMELSGQSSLAVRPRGGGKVAVTFQKIF